ncbi:MULTISPECIES: dihydrofolate reductase family protein [Vagococcus]|uniref:Dihydrofolate reductase n=1 Tax=Vagococcus fluvialis bH819 TaxID=1255619 RepID=A0A1X6WL17_9ENTE|nr:MULTISPECIES: dihydrofolate reductase family protein [Vagococcus]SLM85014.1 Dihydrofolate reductase [Vagococcus fluvialis bH819]HCM88570.1 dihydrofolate reductase [Vagococcus sp.]
MAKRKIILYIATSLDGFIADRNGNIDWLSTNVDSSEIDTSYEDFYQQVDTVILGRTTYDQVTQVLSPDNYPYSDSTSYVLTSRPGESAESIIFTDQPVVEIVNNLKQTNGGNVFIVGGASIIQPLVEANLIDEYQLATIPVILGEGIPLFKSIKEPVGLQIKNISTVNNVVYRTYVKN